MSLTSLWKKAAFELAARDILDAPYAVKEEMKKKGWTFEVQCTPLHPSLFASPAAVTITRSPEGKWISEDAEARAQYRTARRDAAKIVYGLN